MSAARERGRARVLVTGLGAVTAAGPSTADLERALRGSETCIRPLSLLDAGKARARLAGEVAAIPKDPLLPREARARASRSERLAIAAAAEAIAASGLDLARIAPERLGVALGSSTGGMLETEDYVAARHDGRAGRRLRPKLLAASVGSPGALLATALGAAGPRLAPSTACSSSAIALAMALGWVRRGLADVVVAGGADALSRMTFSGFHSLHAMSAEPCRPFDRRRDGMTLGEGAAVLVLESEAHARERGAPAVAELAGAAMSCDASHLTAPERDGAGAARAFARALADAGVGPDRLDYVNAHGTGTVQNDLAEALALRRVLGEATPRVAVSSTKGLIGHLLGAAGAVEAVIGALAIAGGFAPASFNLEEPDPRCELDLVRGGPREMPVGAVASSSYGFGGNNCTLVLRRP